MALIRPSNIASSISVVHLIRGFFVFAGVAGIAGVAIALLRPLRKLGEGVEGVNWEGAIVKSRDRGCSRGAHSNRSRSIAYCATPDSGLQSEGLPNDQLNFSFNWALVVAATNYKTVHTKRRTDIRDSELASVRNRTTPYSRSKIYCVVYAKSGQLACVGNSLVKYVTALNINY